MADVYAPKRRRVARMIKRWNTGEVTLTRTTPGTPNPATPWILGTPTTVVYTLYTRVDGVSSDYVDDTTVLATDLMLIVSPKALLDGEVVDIVPEQTDTLTIDGDVKIIKKIEAVPASGAAARFHLFVAS